MKAREKEIILRDEKAPEEIPALVRRLLAALGEDPEREGLRRTPERVERALRFLTAGYEKDPAKVINSAYYSLAYDEMVIVKDIEFFSLCEHHILPFFGRCHIAYIPKQKVVGLSKLPRLVNVFAHRLQLQERLTNQIARTLWEQLEPKGVGVIVEARHFCMMMRGVEKKGSVTVTSSMLGLFRDNERTRHEFLSLVNSGHRA
ncbi:MAG TPA: GTP cyclohydrolase I FolE [Candidatus Acidoferrales bacterium]|nr:GTP cyclohydrolase I FolE [Candidatus Acidoferrales bacterium]